MLSGDIYRRHLGLLEADSAYPLHRPTHCADRILRRTVHTLNKTITDIHVPSLSDVTFEGEKIPPPVQIPWCVTCLLLEVVSLT